jgi:hypothetical protein
LAAATRRHQPPHQVIPPWPQATALTTSGKSQTERSPLPLGTTNARRSWCPPHRRSRREKRRYERSRDRLSSCSLSVPNRTSRPAGTAGAGGDRSRAGLLALLATGVSGLSPPEASSATDAGSRPACPTTARVRHRCRALSVPDNRRSSTIQDRSVVRTLADCPSSRRLMCESPEL